MPSSPSHPPTATFSCTHISPTLPRTYTGPISILPNKTNTPTWIFPIPCHDCSRRHLSTEQKAIKAEYNPQIQEWRAQIQRAEARIWKGPLLEGLAERKDERVRIVGVLEGEMERRVEGVGRRFVERWGEGR